MKNERLIKLKAAIKPRLWGGTKIHDILHKDTGDIENVAESWEISTHPHGMSGIDSGMYAGKTLGDYFDAVGWDKLGEYGKNNRQLPVMVKYIDATGDLSIQVHPTEEYARAHGESSGKNEIWLVIGAEKNAFIYLGFNRDVTRGEVLEKIGNNSLETLLNKVRVKKGEAFYIPAGTVHAIGKGCLICEIQQTSDVTYRLYDYGRVGADGMPRELHLTEALDVLNYKKSEIKKTGVHNLGQLGEDINDMFAGGVQCSLFKYEAKGEFHYTHPRSRISFAITYKGKGQITCDNVTKNTAVGDTWLLNGKSIRVSGKCRTIIISIWS